MVPLKWRTELALTAGVWVAAIGFASTLAYLLNRPLEERFSFASLIPPTVVTPTASDVTPAADTADTALTVPTLTIVARAPHRHTVPMVLPESYPDIAKLNCSEWRELEQGSGRVQICD